MHENKCRFGALTALLCVMIPVAALAGSDNRAEFGSQWWWQSAPEARYREYMDLVRGGFLDSFTLSNWSARDAFALWGENATRSDQLTHLRLSRGVRWQLDVQDAQIPHDFSDMARTPFVEVRPGVFTLPDVIQSQGQAANAAGFANLMRDVTNNSSRVDNTVQTDVSTMRLRGRPAAGWRFEVRGERRERSGHKPYGTSLGFSNSIELMEPIHQRTMDGSATASYEKSRLRAQATFGMSAFKNFNSEMIWDNPLRLIDVAGTPSKGRIDLYPDNQAVRGNLALAMTLPKRSLLSATVGMSQGKQNDDWMPLTVNTALVQSLPTYLTEKSTDAKMTRINMDFKASTRAWSRGSATVRYNRTQADNKTPEHTLPGLVPYDGNFTAGAVETDPFGNTQSVLGGDVDVRLIDRLGLGVTYELRDREHTLREVEKDKENVVAVRANSDVTEDLHLTASYRRGDRKLDAFNLDDYKNTAGTLTEQANLRRFDVANRVQSAAAATIGWDITSWFEAGVEYNYRLNDYPDSQFGLVREEDGLVMSTGALRPDSRTEIEGGYGFGKNTTVQYSHESSGAAVDLNPGNDWLAKLRDRTYNYYLDAEWWAIPKKFSIGAGYEMERSVGEFSLVGNRSADLPGTFYRRQDTRLSGRWQVAPKTSVEGRWLYEQLDFVDVLKENIPLVQLSNTGVYNSLWLGNSTLDYRAHRVELLMSLKF